jgi:hypothetical protein
VTDADGSGGFADGEGEGLAVLAGDAAGVVGCGMGPWAGRHCSDMMLVPAGSRSAPVGGRVVLDAEGCAGRLMQSLHRGAPIESLDEQLVVPIDGNDEHLWLVDVLSDIRLMRGARRK